MKKIILCISIIFLICLIFFIINSGRSDTLNHSESNNTQVYKSEVSEKKNDLTNNPNNSSQNIYDENIIRHRHYSFVYSEIHEQPLWVKYVNTKQSVSSKNFKRKNNFRTDPLVKTNSASLEDYKKSGYDRGHLCPAGDMAFSEIAMSESFFMSNMSPQHPSFNRGIWKKLESKVREWSNKYDSTIIYCGGVLDSLITTIGPNNVSVPKLYYKVIYCPKIENGIGFILPNKKCDNSLENYVVNIDSVESITHINFYNNLPLNFQENIEKNYTLNLWF